MHGVCSLGSDRFRLRRRAFGRWLGGKRDRGESRAERCIVGVNDRESKNGGFMTAQLLVCVFWREEETGSSVNIQQLFGEYSYKVKSRRYNMY